MNRMTCLLGLLAAGAWADCADIDIRVDSGVAIGTLRVAKGASGFVELHPSAGLSVSVSGVALDGPATPGQLVVQGPAGREVELQLQLLPDEQARDARLDLAEIMVQSGADQARLPADGGLFSVRLPSQGDAEGRARRRIEVGAVVRFRWTDSREAATYRLSAECAQSSR